MTALFLTVAALAVCCVAAVTWLIVGTARAGDPDADSGG